MPKRSNDFQRLIKLIEHQLAPHDAIVSESKMLVDSRNGAEREVDVLIEYKVGEHPISIAVECRDHQRKSDTLWIDQIYGKYQYLPVDKVIAVARAGFWKTANEAARKSGIDTYSLEEAFESNWAEVTSVPTQVRVTQVRFIVQDIAPITDLNILVPSDEPFTIQLYKDGKITEDFYQSVFESLATGELGERVGSLLVESLDPVTFTFDGKPGHNSGYAVPVEPGFLVGATLEYAVPLRGIEIHFSVESEESIHDFVPHTYGKATVGVAEVEYKDVKTTITVVESSSGQESYGISAKRIGKKEEPLRDEIWDAPIFESQRSDGSLHVFQHYLIAGKRDS